MKKLFFFICLFIGFSSFSQNAEVEIIPSVLDSTIMNQSERIISYKSDITVDENAGVSVTETIKVLAKGDKIKRGIFRALPSSRNLNNKNQRVKYDVISVKKNGHEEPFQIKNENGYQNIYIGKREVYLYSGIYEYEIKYYAENQIGFFKDYDELYWNVNGVAWDFPVDSISATVSLPNGAQILQNSCYTGSYGSTDQDCSSKKLSDNRITWTADDLKNKEGLTIAVGFSKGIITPPPPPSFLEKYGILIISLLAFLGLMAYYFNTWTKYGVDPQKPIVYPQFNVPQDLSPASLGYLRKGNFKNRLMTAAIVNLAIKGYLKITEQDEYKFFGLSYSKVFTLEKLKDSDESLPKEEAALMTQLFAYEDSFELKDKYNSRVEHMVDDFKSTLSYEHDTFLNKGNNYSKLWLPALVITIVYGLGLLLSSTLNFAPEKLIIGFILYVVLAVIFIFFTFAIKEFSIPWRFLWFVPIGIFYTIGRGLFANADFASDQNYNICYTFLVLSFTAFVIYSYLIKRPSEEKLETQSLIDGFKMYIGAAESEQLKFHNPPQMTPELFEKILPFAIVLGVDEIWGQKFTSMLKQTDAPYHNTWYFGNTFNSANFGSTLNSNLSQSIQSASTAPSSSGSGSSGGGFSGGGGGGGGGGGW